MLGGIKRKILVNQLEKNLSDETVAKLFTAYLSQFPLENGEYKNMATLSLEKNGKVYIAVVGLSYKNNQFTISKPKKQAAVITAIKELIELSHE